MQVQLFCVLFTVLGIVSAADPPGKLWELPFPTMMGGSLMVANDGLIAVASNGLLTVRDQLTGDLVLQEQVAPYINAVGTATISKKFFCYQYDAQNATCYNLQTKSFIFKDRSLGDLNGCSNSTFVESSDGSSENWLLSCTRGAVAVSLPSGEVKLSLIVGNLQHKGASALINSTLYFVSDIVVENIFEVYDGATLKKTSSLSLSGNTYVICASSTAIYLHNPLFLGGFTAVSPTGKKLWSVAGGGYSPNGNAKCNNEALLVPKGDGSAGILPLNGGADLLGPCEATMKYAEAHLVDGLLLTPSQRPSKLTAYSTASCAVVKTPVWDRSIPVGPNPGIVHVGSLPGAPSNGTFAVYNNIGINFLDTTGDVVEALAGYRFAYFSGVANIAIGGTASAPLLFVFQGFSRPFMAPETSVVASRIVPSP